MVMASSHSAFEQMHLFLWQIVFQHIDVSWFNYPNAVCLFLLETFLYTQLCALIQLFLYYKVLNLDLLGAEDVLILSFDTFCQTVLRNAAPIYVLTSGTWQYLLPTSFPIMGAIMSFHLYQSDGEKKTLPFFNHWD